MGGKMSNAYYRDYRSSHKEQRAVISKESVNRCRYALTPEEFQEFLRRQHSACAICKDKFSEESIPYIDHDHSSGWVRGLLCRDCNFAIGLLREDIDRFQSAAAYLVSTATPTEFNFGAAKAAVRNFRKHTDEFKAAMSALHKGNTYRQGIVPWNKGKEWSEETKQKMRKPHRKRGNNGRAE
jgi:hypothetical protein